MQDILVHPPRSIMELYKMLPEGTLAEVIDGALYMSPSPNNYHQIISMNLSAEIWNYIKKNKIGTVLTAPCDVYLDEKNNAVQPDIIVILNPNRSIIQDHIHGVPDMIIEILSPGNTPHDTVRKKELYERFGVKEYWTVNPQTKEAKGFDLKGEQYREIGTFHRKIVSVLLNHEFSFEE